MNLTPETHHPTPTFYYEDLKQPFLRRGLSIPHSLSDYINALKLRESLEREEFEEIRTEMKHIFTQNGVEIPEDFDENFNQWFHLSFGDSETDTDRDPTPRFPSQSGEQVERQEAVSETQSLRTGAPQGDPVSLSSETHTELTAKNTIADFQEVHGCSYERARQLWHAAGGQDAKAERDAELLGRILEMQAQGIPDTAIVTKLNISRGKLQSVLKKHATA